MGELKRKGICIISYSNILYDARVLRQIDYLSKYFDLSIIGYGDLSSSFLVNSPLNYYNIPRRKKSIIRKFFDFFRIIRYYFGIVDRPNVLRYASDQKCDVYLANNWDTLPIAAEAAKINKSILVLDIHESLITSSGKLYSYLNKRIVQKYTDQINASTTVVNAIAKDYLETFGFEPIVLRNIPQINYDRKTIKKTFEKKIQLVSHGVASKQRGTEILIRTIEFCDPVFELHLIFINNKSKYVEYLKVLSNQIAPGRVFFHDPTSPSEIVNFISKFDIGLYPILPTNYNNLIALPNKFFDFIAAGLALCIGPSPSMVETINKYGNGIVSDSFSPIDIAKLLNKTKISDWDKMKQASLNASKELNADIEMQKLLDIVNHLLVQDMK